MIIEPETSRAFFGLAANLAQLGVPEPPSGDAPVETLIVRTDANWQVSADGRSWVQATPYSAFYRHGGIWDASPGGWNEVLFFRATFLVAGEVRSIRAEGGSDDDLLSFLLNGAFLFGESTGYSDLLLRDNAVDPTLINQGENTVRAHARNIGGHSSFGAEIAIEFVPTPVFAAALWRARDEGGLILQGGRDMDELTGTERADLLSGSSGADFLRGLSGSDTLLGGPGDDRLRGGLGDDLIDGGEGNDRIFATMEAATAGWGSQDTLIGGSGSDQLFGSAGDDLIHGGEGQDLFVGDHGADTIYGGSGADRASGGGGDDVMRLGEGDDLVFHDTSRLHDYGRGDDSLYGEAGNDRLHGGRGNDLVDGGSGDDVLNGGPGLDLLRGGAGADTFEFRSAYGTDRVADFAAGDRLALSNGVNGIGPIATATLLDRIVAGDGGARLDLGGGDAVIFEGLSIEVARSLLATSWELI